MNVPPTDEDPRPDPTPAPSPVPLVPSPFLHLEGYRVVNPLTGGVLLAGEPLFEAFRRLREAGSVGDPTLEGALREGLWAVPEGKDLSTRFRLRVVSLEAHSVCNQACYFCPVATAPRATSFMPTELYERIVAELSAFSDTIEGVCMNNYNEPTVDKRFVSQVALLKSAGLPPAVLSNGSGLTPERVDALLALGGLRYLSVNISTLERERYARDRGVDQLDLVVKHIDYMKDKPVAAEMDLVVLGQGDEPHQRAHREISERYAGSRFNVRPFEARDRAGWLPTGLRPAAPHAKLRGCDNVGSRPLEHLHVTADGRCIFCCEDYDEKYVVGDLNRQSVREVLTGPALALLRRWSYGVEEAPHDFICRSCVAARTESE